MIEGISVGILRPPALSRVNMLREEHEQKHSMARSRWVECVEERIEDIRRILEELTDQLDTRLNVTEYQTHEDGRGIGRITGKRARRAGDNDILMSVDPTPMDFNFVTKPRADMPLQRAIIAYTDKGELMDCMSLIAANRVLMVRQGARMEAVQRIFAVHAPLEDSTAADALGRQRYIFERAIRYPDIPSVPVTSDPLDILILDEDDPISSQESGYIREAEDVG